MKIKGGVEDELYGLFGLDECLLEFVWEVYVGFVVEGGGD